MTHSKIHVVYGLRPQEPIATARRNPIVQGFGKSDVAALKDAINKHGDSRIPVIFYFVRSNGELKRAV